MGSDTAALVAELRKDVKCMQKELSAVQEQVAAMRNCLDLSGTVPRERFLIELHRHRFNRIMRFHPSSGRYDLEGILTIGNVANACLKATNFCSARALRGTCKAFAKVGPDVQCEVPPGIPVAVGGEVHLWHPSLGTMSALPQPIGPVHGGSQAAAQICGQIYRCGGSGPGRSWSNLDCLNPHSGSWTPLPEMSFRRIGHTATALQGSLYVCGGARGGGYSDIHRSVERFDPESESWLELSPMSMARVKHGAATLGGQLYVCGGILGEGNGRVGSVERFDPSTGEWTLMPPMLSGPGRHYAAALQGRLYVLTDARTGTVPIESFDPTTRSWSPLEPMTWSGPRVGHLHAASAWDRKLFIAYGTSDRNGRPSITFTQSLDTSTGVWEQVPLVARELALRRG
mmetsp:Transcript_1019/g.2549  ORF Transcript_1019/g.2549 Transcript_1019/m.2549 type:complete len:400 (-) Transcript_1019:71-1270(-)